MTFAFQHRQDLDQFEEKTRLKATAGKCEGSCDSHKGPTKVFRVADPDGTDWGWFSYCEAAQEEDRQQGFLLFTQTPSSGKD